MGAEGAVQQTDTSQSCSLAALSGKHAASTTAAPSCREVHPTADHRAPADGLNNQALRPPLSKVCAPMKHSLCSLFTEQKPWLETLGRSGRADSYARGFELEAHLLVSHMV